MSELEKKIEFTLSNLERMMSDQLTWELMVLTWRKVGLGAHAPLLEAVNSHLTVLYDFQDWMGKFGRDLEVKDEEQIRMIQESYDRLWHIHYELGLQMMGAGRQLGSD